MIISLYGKAGDGRGEPALNRRSSKRIENEDYNCDQRLKARSVCFIEPYFNNSRRNVDLEVDGRYSLKPAMDDLLAKYHG